MERNGDIECVKPTLASPVPPSSNMYVPVAFGRSTNLELSTSLVSPTRWYVAGETMRTIGDSAVPPDVDILYSRPAVR